MRCRTSNHQDGFFHSLSDMTMHGTSRDASNCSCSVAAAPSCSATRRRRLHRDRPPLRRSSSAEPRRRAQTRFPDPRAQPSAEQPPSPPHWRPGQNEHGPAAAALLAAAHGPPPCRKTFISNITTHTLHTCAPLTPYRPHTHTPSTVVHGIFFFFNVFPSPPPPDVRSSYSSSPVHSSPDSSVRYSLPCRVGRVPFAVRFVVVSPSNFLLVIARFSASVLPR